MKLNQLIYMKTQKVIKTIYIANDGKEFLTKEECEKHEKFVKDILSKIKYFSIKCDPDLTETGYYQRNIYVAVLSEYFYHEEIAIEWALRKFGHLLGESVMGYGIQPKFIVEVCQPIDWGNSKLKGEKIFLSPKSVDGFPENIDYMKEWGFK